MLAVNWLNRDSPPRAGTEIMDGSVQLHSPCQAQDWGTGAQCNAAAG